MLQFEETAAPVRYFFRKENRLLKRADFLRVYDKGKAHRRPLLHVFIMPPTAQTAADEHTALISPGLTRLGITVTRKAGNSVKRNRGRRLVRESFRHMLPELKPGYWIVVNVMRAATTAPYVKVNTQLRDVLAQAGLFQDRNP